MMESYQSNHIQQNPQVLQQKRSDDALSVGSDSAYSTDSGGKIILNTCDNLLNIEYFRFKAWNSGLHLKLVLTDI